MDHTVSRMLNASALKHVLTPLFVCDEDFRLCMYSDSLPSIMPAAVIGKGLAELFSPSVRAMLADLSESCVQFNIALPACSGTAFAVAEWFEGSRIYIISLNTIPSAPIENSRPFSPYMERQIVQTLRELLHTPAAACSRFHFSDAQLKRLVRCAQFSSDSGAVVHATELIPYLQDMIRTFTPRLAAFGVSLAMTEQGSHVFFGGCEPKCFGSVMSILIAAAVCVSSDGEIRLSCEDDPDNFRNARVSVIVPHPSADFNITDWNTLTDSLFTLRLDLLSLSELMENRQYRLDCVRRDGALRFEWILPYVQAGKVVFHSPAYTMDSLYLRELAKQCESILVVWRDYEAGNR